MIQHSRPGQIRLSRCSWLEPSVLKADVYIFTIGMVHNTFHMLARKASLLTRLSSGIDFCWTPFPRLLLTSPLLPFYFNNTQRNTQTQLDINELGPWLNWMDSIRILQKDQLNLENQMKDQSLVHWLKMGILDNDQKLAEIKGGKKTNGLSWKFIRELRSATTSKLLRDERNSSAWNKMEMGVGLPGTEGAVTETSSDWRSSTECSDAEVTAGIKR